MTTLLDQAIGVAEIVHSYGLTGPNRGTGWTRYTLSDGRIALRGPYVQNLPKWLAAVAPAGQHFIHAGGTTYRWSGWISQYY